VGICEELSTAVEKDVNAEPASASPQAAIQRGIDWLLACQQDDGHWSNPRFPALTALPLQALLKGGCSDTNAIQKAIDFITSCVQPNGGIYCEPKPGNRRSGGLSNYNTAVCLMALHEAGRAELAPVILKAREFLAKSQKLEGDSEFRGGFGYTPEQKDTDLSNSHLAYGAMKLTEVWEDNRTSGQQRVDLDWEAAREFLERVQNDPDVNSASWVSDTPSEEGGFIYRPDFSTDGSFTNQEGVVKFRSAPGMTYAGLLSYIYADVDRDDPRVRATVKWIAQNWDLNTATRNPEKMGTPKAEDGLFYMYNVMAKGLAAYGQDVLTSEEHGSFNWRSELSNKLLSMKRTDEQGNDWWVNTVSRFWEGDPVLVTSYSVLALEYANPEQSAE
jgi:squalene-hopene/tetraprenyl-beta-curcumene cyclase